MLDLGISVVFPAYNEEKNIKETINDAIQYLKTINDEWEIIVVNDGSKDKTGILAQEISNGELRVKVIHHSLNEGYGKALKHGFAASRFEYVFFTDSDRQFDLKFLDVMWPLAKTEGVDIVIGYRIRRQDHFLRKLLSRGYNSFVGFLFDLDVNDINCAFKIFKKSIFEKIKIESSSFFVNAEVLAKAKFYNYKMLEIGVPHFPRKEGKTSVSLKYIPITLKEFWMAYISLNRIKMKSKTSC